LKDQRSSVNHGSIQLRQQAAKTEGRGRRGDARRLHGCDQPPTDAPNDGERVGAARRRRMASQAIAKGVARERAFRARRRVGLEERELTMERSRGIRGSSGETGQR
jgi:hypothetical protein